jgi:hypothetical protein
MPLSEEPIFLSSIFLSIAGVRRPIGDSPKQPVEVIAIACRRRIPSPTLLGKRLVGEGIRLPQGHFNALPDVPAPDSPIDTIFSGGLQRGAL